MRTRMKQCFSCLLCLTLLLALLPAAATALTASVGTSWSDTVDVAASETISGPVTAADGTILHIPENVVLTIDNTITVSGGGTLTVTGDGKLVVASSTNDAYVKGGLSVEMGHTGAVEITVNCVTVSNALAVDTGLTVKGGAVTVTGGGGFAPEITVDGGKVLLSSTNGGADLWTMVTLSGGEFQVTGSSTINGSVTIADGKTFTDGETDYTSADGAAAKAALAAGKTLRTPWKNLAWLMADDHTTSCTLTADIKADADDTALAVPANKSFTLYMNGKTIDRNLSAAAENGCVLKVLGSLTVDGAASGGGIAGGFNNGDGGGIYVAESGSLVLKNTAILSNRCTGNGAGVYAGGDLTVFDGTTIRGNNRPVGEDSPPNNIYLPAGKTVAIGGELTPSGEAAFGVTMAKPGVFTAGGSFASDAAARGVFMPDDNASYLVVRTSAGEAALAPAKCTVRYDAAPTGGTLTVKAGDSTVANGSKVDYGTELSLAAAASEGYELDVLTVTVAGGEPVTLSGSTYIVTGDVTLAASFKIVETPTFAVTVEGGTGSGDYAEGVTVSIAATVPEGKAFDKWTTETEGVSFADANASSTTFSMPAKAVAVKANFKTPEPTKYAVTVEGGTGSGDYAEGVTVSIAATVPEGKVFDKWTTETEGVSFADANAASTTFTMPAKAVTVTATFGNKPTPPAPVPMPEVMEPFSFEFQSPMTFEGGSVEITPQKAGAGTKVTLTVLPDEGQELKNLKVRQVGVKDLAVVQNADGTYSFTMPGGKVEINAAFGPAEAQQAANETPAHAETGIVQQALNVQLSRQRFLLNGVELDVKAYNINGRNYVMLRDLAVMLAGTSAQFNVKYDEKADKVIIERGGNYVGTLSSDPTDLSVTAQKSRQAIYLGEAELLGLNVFNIGGNNYFSLRELATILGYSVDYDEASDTAIIKA